LDSFARAQCARQPGGRRHLLRDARIVGGEVSLSPPVKSAVRCTWAITIRRLGEKLHYFTVSTPMKHEYPKQRIAQHAQPPVTRKRSSDEQYRIPLSCSNVSGLWMVVLRIMDISVYAIQRIGRCVPGFAI
jgi:hypothetical protein